MTRIKERISTLVNNQLPEFIRADYPLFVTFLEAYYKFLEQDQNAFEIIQNSRSYHDIDETIDSFLNYFLNQYARDIPSTVLTDKRFLLKNINQFYQSKGSSLSFETLFNILYSTSVNVKYPYENVLRPSDGIWEQRVTLRIRLLDGSADDIIEKYLRLSKNNIIYNDSIVDIRILDSDLFEVYLKNISIAPYDLGDAVYVYSGSSIIFTGVVEPTTVDYSITEPGQNFKVGQVFTINIGIGVNTLVKITKVNSTGGIVALKFLNYGYNYSDDFTLELNSDLTVTTRTESFLTRTGGYSEFIEINKYYSATDPNRYFLQDYVEEGYTGNVESTATVTSQVATSTTVKVTTISGDTAVITFILGAVARYPGQYLSSKGFLSDSEIRLQDSNLYQPFAYQLQTELDINIFYDVVKSLAHPAGTNMFNNRLLSTTVDLATNTRLYSSINENTASFVDYIGAQDSINIVLIPFS